MIRFRLMLTVLLMFAALFSVQANAASSMQTFQMQSITQVATAIDAKFSDLQSTVTNSPGSAHLAADKKPQGAGFASLQPRLTASNASLFLYHTQVEPNYAAIFEFFVPSLARQLYLQPLEPPIRLPWFVS